METFGLRVPNRNFGEFSLVNVDFKSRKSPSTGCASAPSAVQMIPIYSMDVRSRVVRCCWTSALIKEKFKNGKFKK